LVGARAFIFHMHIPSGKTFHSLIFFSKTLKKFCLLQTWKVEKNKMTLHRVTAYFSSNTYNSNVVCYSCFDWTKANFKENLHINKSRNIHMHLKSVTSLNYYSFNIL
jgi:hypothetical protein